MKKSITKIFTIAACAAMMLTATPVANVQAAATSQGTINLATQKLVIKNGTSTAMASKTVTMVKARRYQVKAKFGSTTVTTKGTYKSSKTSVATVSSTGLVTAKAPGTATISVTYNGTKQTFKVKVVASHTHSWKTTAKATCAAKGKRLCKTCGVVGSTAKKTTHTWKTTKKATCQTAGKQTCTVCGTAKTVAKTAHKYVTETWTGVEGRGKKSYVNTFYCNGCGIDMTGWSHEKRQTHWSDIPGILAGTSNENCWGAGTNGAAGEERYSKYVVVENTETYCKTCGAHKDLIEKDLYEVYYDEWRNLVRKSDGTIIQESVWYKNYKPYLEKQEAAKKAAASNTASQAKAASVASVATFSLMNDEVPVEDVVVADENIMVAGEAIEAEEAVVPADEVLVEDAEAISGNEAVSENNITDLETGSDVSFEKADTEDGDDGIAIEEVAADEGNAIVLETETDANNGIMVTSLDNEDGIAVEKAKDDTIVSVNSVIEEKPVYIEKTVISGNDIILTNELVSESKLATTNAKTNGNFVALLSHAVIDNNTEEPEEEDTVIVEEDDEDEVVTEEDEEGEIVPEDE